jgi:hypothetical protein
MCSIVSLSRLAHPAPSLLSFRTIPVLSLLVAASESRHHFPPFRALSPQVHRNILCHASLILPVVPRFLLVRISVPLVQLRTHPSAFRSQSFHFLTSIPIPPAVLLSLLLIAFFFYSLYHSVSIPHSPLSPILSSNFAALFPPFTLSLLLLHCFLTAPWCFSVHS